MIAWLHSLPVDEFLLVALGAALVAACAIRAALFLMLLLWQVLDPPE